MAAAIDEEVLGYENVPAAEWTAKQGRGKPRVAVLQEVTLPKQKKGPSLPLRAVHGDGSPTGSQKSWR